MKALITAGGHGTRLRPITHTKNKHLIPIANKPMLNYALEYVRDAGISEVGIVVNVADTEIEKVFGNGADFDLNISYIPQEGPLGLAHVVKIAESFIGDETFIFYLGDNILVGGIKKFIDKFEKDGSNCHLVLSRVTDPQRFGVPEIVNGRIVSVEEKPQNPKSQFAVTGIYIYDNSIFEAVNNIQPSARGELEISDAHQYLLEKRYQISFSEITGWWKDTGKVIDLLEANRLILENLKATVSGDVDNQSTVTGNVTIGKGSTITNSVLRGPIIVGNNVKIYDAYIGPNTSIADGCRIIASEVEYSILMDNSKIEDLHVRMESSLLGHGVEIIQSSTRPKTHRFMIGDQSRIRLS
ncbi:MAG: glucose-1-phosphate thymidylyltransferase [Candidatus Marinimicrobia bacterium]|nr:glucose-1-phosphate thymidylyltransferase [Candidatus Neomarinimicrobiota bacterium]